MKIDEKTTKSCVNCGNKKLGLVRTGLDPFKYCVDCNTYMSWFLEGSQQPIGYKINK